MKYYYSRIIDMNFDDLEKRVVDELKKEGFGILTEIDVREKFREKLDIDYVNYKILGACNPPYAHKALELEDKIGTMLPCNVIIHEIKGQGIEVAAVDPVVSMSGVENTELKKIAEEIRNKLQKTIDNI